MKILIIGKNGQLGSDCVQVLQKSYDILALSSKELDITDLTAVDDLVGRYHPTIVLNAAAFTKVDACETERELASRLNAIGPRNLALSLAKFDGQLIHISTDYVFNGQKPPPEPYVEDDEVGPISYYGKTKLEGELAIREIAENYIIVRTAWLYGLRGQNFLKTMLRLALREPPQEIRVVDDQYGSPTWSYRLALQLAKLIEINGQGTYHATAEGFCTWYEVARHFFQQMGLAPSVIPCTTSEYPTPARRPQNSILENYRLKQAGINVMRPWQTDLDDFIVNYGQILRNQA